MHEPFRPLIDELHQLQVLPLSYSKAKLMLACPRQYKARYIDRAEGGVALDRESAVVGKFVHSVMQYCLDKGRNFGYSLETVDFDRTWQQVARQSQLTHREYDMAQDLRIHAENVLERLIRAVQAHELEVLTEAPLVMTLDGAVKGNARWERRFLYGLVDFLGLTPNQRRALIVDYKTHGTSLERREDEMLQTSLYAWMTFLRFPTVQVIQAGCAYIPDENVEFFATFHRGDQALIDTVHAFLCSFRDNYVGSDFGPSKSKYCDWCNYRSTCPAQSPRKRKQSKK